MSLEISKCRDKRGGYVLRAECVLPQPVEQVFAFFSDAFELERLTPPWLNFQVLTPRPIDMHIGQKIDYRLRVRGVPVRWQSLNSAWEPNHRFVDEALRSPYHHWHHEHRFEPCAEGTRAIDIVHYGVPGGALVHWLLVGRDVRKIFEYRQQALTRYFVNTKSTN